MSRLDFLREPDYSGAFLIWVGSGLVLQGSAALAVVLLDSAVSHLPETGRGDTDAAKRQT